jgi:glycosyltransferase involved in cell wall biosynthesis
MKILYTFRALAVWGGIERILVDKMNFLVVRYGMDVYLLTTDQGTHPIPYELSAGVHHEDLNICFYKKYRYHGLRRLITAKRMLRRYEELLAERLNTINPDVIVCTTADHLSSIVKVKGAIPLVVESHSICARTIEDGRYWLQRKLYRHSFLHALSKTDVLVVLTEGDAQEWRKYHCHVCVIPNFVHPHKDCISDQQSKRVIFVGRFDYQKRVQDAIQIWSIVKNRYPDWTFDIFGEGGLLQEVKSLASTVGNIVVHQPTKEIFQAYSNSSILMITSLFEPFGLVILEAMSCGLPVVSFDCPYGPKEILTDGVDGFLVKDYDNAAMAKKICQLIEDNDLRYRMGRNGIISSHIFTHDIIMPIWKGLFEQLLGI